MEKCSRCKKLTNKKEIFGEIICEQCERDIINKIKTKYKTSNKIDDAM